MPPVKRPLLLLIASDPEFIYLIKRYGEWSGCRVVNDGSIDRALAGSLREWPAMVFLHLLWGPDADWSSLRCLKEHDTTQGIPITIISAMADEARARGEGADYWLWQPVMYADFLAALVATRVLPIAGQEAGGGSPDG